MNGRTSKRTQRAERPAAAVRVARPAIADWTSGIPVFVPQGYESGYDYPLLVWVADPTDRAFDLARVMVRLSLRNFVAVQASGGETAVWRAIDTVRDRLSIHPRRIWLIGQGGGGTEAFRIGCRHPDAFGGVVSLGGPFPLDESAFARVTAVRRLPMLYCCRHDAAAVAGTERMLRLFHAAGASLAMRIYSGAGTLSRAALEDVNRWLMDEICGTPARERAESAG
jgi:pimeloyl-ACP methyl ester carboxylesterase